MVEKLNRSDNFINVEISKTQLNSFAQLLD